MREYHGLSEAERELLERAKEALPRLASPARSLDEPALAVILARFIRQSYDPEKALDKSADRDAKKLLNKAAKIGTTEPDRQLFLPGLAPYDFEPERLVRDGASHIMENQLALFEFKVEDRNRAKENLDRISLQYTRKDAEVSAFAKYRAELAAAGRPILNRTWGECVAANNLLR